MQMRIPSKDFEKIFPIMAIRDGVVISKRGDVTIGWRLSLPPQYSLDAASYTAIHNQFHRAIKDLPDWTMVHRQDVFFRRKYKSKTGRGFLDRSYQNHFRGREYLEHEQYVFLTLTNKFTAVREPDSCGVLGMSAKLREGCHEDIFRIGAIGEEFIYKLTDTRVISAERLSDQELVERMYSHMSMGTGDGILSDIDMYPDHMEANGKQMWAYVINEGKHLPSELQDSRKVEKVSTPLSALGMSLGASLGTLLDCEHIVNSYVLMIPRKEAISELEARQKKMFSMSSRDSENRKNNQEIESYLGEDLEDEKTTVRAHTNILVFGHKEEQSMLRAKVSAALSQMNIVRCVNVTYDTPVLWHSSLPGASCEIGARNLMLNELGCVLCLWPMESFQRDIEGGTLPLCDRSRNIPVAMDMQKRAFEAGLISNYNAFFLGGSGSGKSFFTNYFVRNSYDSGDTIFIIDKGYSYEGLCSVIREESDGRDGIYLKWERQEDSNVPGMSFNIFWDMDQWLSKSGDLNADCIGLGFVQSVIQTIWKPQGGWDSASGNIITQILKDFCLNWQQSDRPPVFDDLFDFINTDIVPLLESEHGYTVNGVKNTTRNLDINSMCTALGAYAKKGAYRQLLNGTGRNDIFSSRFTVFEVDSIENMKDGFYEIAVLCIMNAFEAKMRAEQETHKVLIIEEAWKAIANETMAGYLLGLWKTARKLNTAAIVVTQEFDDIIASPVIKNTIMQNSDVKVILEQTMSRVVIDQLGEFLGLDDHQKALVLSLNRGMNSRYRYKEVFISLGSKLSGVYATEVSPQEALAYESAQNKKKEMLELIQNTSPIRAIRQLTSRSHEKV